uniref:Uncharacterized protein n=1 Tax=Oryza punctata TaxID=4537 RepID=A0A0E0M5I8_ORYPU
MGREAHWEKDESTWRAESSPTSSSPPSPSSPSPWWLPILGQPDPVAPKLRMPSGEDRAYNLAGDRSIDDAYINPSIASLTFT